MAKIVIVGAGIGGIPMAFEMKELARQDDEVVVIADTPTFHFVPSNPWVGVNWRKPEDIKVPLEPVFKKKKITFIQQQVTRFQPEQNQLELADGQVVSYDYLIIATGPKLAFDEIPGLGPNGFTESICHVDHAGPAGERWNDFVQAPGPIIIGAVQGASCFGPAYEYMFTVETDLRQRKIRDQVKMTYVTAEPYIGHLGLDGVGDTKGMLESEMRNKHIDWICNAKVDKVENGMMYVTEVDENGQVKKQHELPFKHSMMLPAFKGVDALFGIEKLTNPRGFVLVDEHQRNPTYKNIYSVGVCIAIPPQKPTPVPTGIPKTGYMIESMVTATAHNIREELDGGEPSHKGTWNALCLADFGDSGIAFLAMPQIPPRNVQWAARGKWVHWAKIGYEKYFMRKVRKGLSEPFYERLPLKIMGIMRLKK
ncbi:MAG: FAD-dependent oxidoreductase [Methylovulum sp.]|jgi:sulfide:quinone oxidoreductase|nr:FAD-dependent oxidoreductase [Methylovulum sp.]MCF7998480.1 FAD-dependent oxidoreductase [Methylovulum sp.]